MHKAVFSCVLYIDLLSYCLKLFEKKSCWATLIFNSRIETLLGHQYTPLLGAPKPVPHQHKHHKVAIILSRNIVMHWGALLYDVGSLT